MSETDATVQAALVAERLHLCDFLRSLDDAAWSAPSRCDGWTVHNVVAHLTLSTRTSMFDFTKGMLRHRGAFDEMNAVDARRRAEEFSPVELLEQLHDDARSTKKSFGSSPADGLTDAIVHGQDISRALDRTHSTPPDRVVLALDHVITSRWYPAKNAFADTTVTATDAVWSHGTSGERVTGPAIDLLLAATGRRSALGHLTGSGLDPLRRRLT